jgi:uncharacterized membrane protein
MKQKSGGKMSTRNMVIVSVVLLIVAVFVGMALYPQLPARMASHWNAAGQVDGYMPRFWAVALMPLLAAGFLLLALLIPRIDPLRGNIERFRGYFNTFIVLMMLFLFYMHGLTLAWNLGYTDFDMGTAMMPALGLLFIYIGVMMRKAERNWFIGIRTPWTLSSDFVWKKTHSLGAVLYIAAGLLALMGIFFSKYAVWFLLVPLFAVSIFLVGYSYVLYQKEEREKIS